MRAPTREVDVEEFATHVATGLEAWLFIKEFECSNPIREIRDTDPEPMAPAELPALEDASDDDPLC